MTGSFSYDKDAVILRLSTVNEFDLCVTVNLLYPDIDDEVFIHEVISYDESDAAIREATQWAKQKNYIVFISRIDASGEEVITQL